jgi:hypothetical protein
MLKKIIIACSLVIGLLANAVAEVSTNQVPPVIMVKSTPASAVNSNHGGAKKIHSKSQVKHHSVHKLLKHKTKRNHQANSHRKVAKKTTKLSLHKFHHR